MHDVIDRNITALLDQFSNSNFRPTENINITLDAFEVRTPIQFQNVVSAIRSGNRQQVTEALFLGNYENLTNLILRDPRMTREDACLILEGISQQLPRYNSSEYELGFSAWCETIIKRQADFYALRRQYRNSVRKGLWSVLRNCADLGFDYSAFAELENKTWMKIYLQLEGLLIPGTASLKNRLYGLARWEARAWRTERLRNRAKYISIDEFVRREEGVWPIRNGHPNVSDTPATLTIDANSELDEPGEPNRLDAFDALNTTH
jgi:hypothetical protein